MRSFSGASIRRVIDRSDVQVPEHVHDWPVLSLFVMGSYRNETEIGEKFIAGPSAIFYRAQAPHRNTSGPVGFEQIEIEFDPAWLGSGLAPSVPAMRWIGGKSAAEVRQLVRTCEQGASEDHIRAALQQFLVHADQHPQRDPAHWIGTITQRLLENASLKVGHLAQEVGRHPSWTGSAYRKATGESMQETAARFRVERATCLLRETDSAYAAVALESGFCDQSHMNRSFRRVLGRCPAIIRQDGKGFRHVPVLQSRVSNCI